MLYGTLSVGVSFQAVATGFTSADFLKLDDSYKKFWIQGAVDTYAHVAANHDKETGMCVANWYYGEKRPERNSLILASMEKYPKVSPSSIIMALMERACGKLKK